jgi:hypothetical protein
MVAFTSDSLNDLERRWQLREEQWARKLGRLRLGVEPLDEQLARYRRVTLALTIVPGVIAAMFLALFAAFGRPDIGLVVIGVLFVPIIAGSWIGYLRLRWRARAYLKELAAYQEERERRLAGEAGTATTP